MLKAPRERVWLAIVDSRRFGTAMQEPWAGMACDFHVQRIQPMDYFAFRWHAYAEGPVADPDGVHMTLVEFHLADADGGTRLRIVESGFDRVPAGHRAKAFADNEGGWTMQLALIGKYLERRDA